MLFNLSNQAPNCNSFPKVFGGEDESTYLNHFDVFGDYLAMVGNTRVGSMSGKPPGQHRPFIVVSSVTMSDFYYWAYIL